MMRYLAILLMLSAFSCAKKEADKPKEAQKEKSRFDMYEMSEMSLFMERMYLDQQKVRKAIEDGSAIAPMPEDYTMIRTARMTDPEENDAFFKSGADAFLAARQKIGSDPSRLKEDFNASVDACISCHKVKCGGPIARIKKLYIK